jgi:acyl-CoA thioester hydrolase
MIRHSTKIRVRYADTDQMKTVYHGKYFDYFESGRAEMIRSLGLSYAEFEQLGYVLPVIEAHVRFLKPVRYDDVIEVVAILREAPAVKLRLDYEVYRDGETELLAEGYTVHGFVSAETGRPTRAPEQFLEIIRKGGLRI